MFKNTRRPSRWVVRTRTTKSPSSQWRAAMKRNTTMRKTTN